MEWSRLVKDILSREEDRGQTDFARRVIRLMGIRIHSVHARIIIGVRQGRYSSYGCMPAPGEREDCAIARPTGPQNLRAKVGIPCEACSAQRGATYSRRVRLILTLRPFGCIAWKKRTGS